LGGGNEGSIVRFIKSGIISRAITVFVKSERGHKLRRSGEAGFSADWHESTDFFTGRLTKTGATTAERRGWDCSTKGRKLCGEAQRGRKRRKKGKEIST